MKEMKYVLVTGGVISGLGKGITSSSVGLLLKQCGFRVTAIKIDPYLNTDAGTMSPFEHGEVFVVDDGGETDLDLGSYERFLDISLTRNHNITTGKIYSEVIRRERKGDYLGKTVQVVPHITNAIQDWMTRTAAIPVDNSGEPPEVCMVELGGTVGDIEGMIFLEAMRQFRYKVGENNFCHLHVSLVPNMTEPKSKPTQHGVKNLRSAGLQPDMIMCRAKQEVPESIRRKISNFCMVPLDQVISVHNVADTYAVPLLLASQNVHVHISKKLSLEGTLRGMTPWENLLTEKKGEVRIAIVGKYVELHDAYLSVMKALYHAAYKSKLHLNILWINSEKIESIGSWQTLERADGILIPGGFGDRGIRGKLVAAEYARTKRVPLLGICLGMQIMVIEYARNVLNWSASSEEFDPNSVCKVIINMPEISSTHMGGTMRLGSRLTSLKMDSLAHSIYKKPEVAERHRHRYEVNPDCVQDLEKAGLIFSGRDDRKERMEIVELSEETHPFYLGTQFHPEFKSRPLRPSPVFHWFVEVSHRTRQVPRTTSSTVQCLYQNFDSSETEDTD